MMALLTQGNSSIEVQFWYRPPIAVPMPMGAYHWQESRDIDIRPMNGGRLSPGPAVLVMNDVPRRITVCIQRDGLAYGRLGAMTDTYRQLIDR